jgi:hypothetical protein
LCPETISFSPIAVFTVTSFSAKPMFFNNVGEKKTIDFTTKGTEVDGSKNAPQAHLP